MAIDGRGMFLTCKYAIEQMLITGGGSIVCLSSISGVAGQAQYAGTLKLRTDRDRPAKLINDRG